MVAASRRVVKVLAGRGVKDLSEKRDGVPLPSEVGYLAMRSVGD